MEVFDVDEVRDGNFFDVNLRPISDQFADIVGLDVAVRACQEVEPQGRHSCHRRQRRANVPRQTKPTSFNVFDHHGAYTISIAVDSSIRDGSLSRYAHFSFSRHHN